MVKFIHWHLDENTKISIHLHKIVVLHNMAVSETLNGERLLSQTNAEIGQAVLDASLWFLICDYIRVRLKYAAVACI